jgi:hypothetical protein
LGWGKARAFGGWAQRAVLFVLTGAGACERVAGERAALSRSEHAETPTLVRQVPLPHSVAAPGALSVTAGGRLWIGQPGVLIALDPLEAEPLLRAEFEPATPPRLLGYAGERYYVLIGDELLTLDETGAVRMRRGGVGASAVALDPLGRHVYLATDRGAVLGLDPRLLRPRWAWPRLGQPALGAVPSPEGDRLYLLLAPGADEGPRVLTRDVQTGRILAELELELPLQQLQAAHSGWVYGLELDTDEARVVALQPGLGGLRVAWRRSIPGGSPNIALQLRVSPAGDRVVVFAGTSAGGLLVFDARTGRPLDGVLEPPIDAGFGHAGTLYLLFPEEIRVLQ